MGDFFMDDAFFDHPKALHAGEDAANLYVRGLAWAHKHNTPMIPVGALGSLTSKANPKKLAAKLCEVAPGFTNPLWYDRGGHYEIHDWEVRNAKSIAKRKQAKKAAHARWDPHRKQCETDADAYADASDSHVLIDADSNALPTKEPRNQGTTPKPPPALTVVSSDDGAAGLVEQVIDAVARRQMARVTITASESGWLAKARSTLRAEHAAYIREHASDGFEALVDAIEPVKQAPVPVSAFLPFHPCDCSCAGQGTDRTCTWPAS